MNAVDILHGDNEMKRGEEVSNDNYNKRKRKKSDDNYNKRKRKKCSTYLFFPVEGRRHSIFVLVN